MKELGSLFNFTASYIVVNEALRSRISDIAHLKFYPSNSIASQEGQYSRHFGYLSSGCVRFFANFDGKEVTTWLEVENQVLPSCDGFSFKKAGV